MKLIVPVFTALILFLSIAGASHAGPFKTHVAEFNVSGVPNGEGLKLTLQGILTSRINPDLVQLVEKPEQAEILVVGSYALFGKMFSLDVLIKNSRQGSLIKVFEQGEGQEDIIPAVGRLARKIDAELLKIPTPVAPIPSTRAPLATSEVMTVPSLPTPPPAVSPTTVKENYVIRQEHISKGSPDGWSSAPIEGVFNSIAMGRTLPSGERELFVAGERTVRAYLQGKDLKLLAEITIPIPAKILAIDTADLDRNGTPELYITIVDRESPGSSVYQFDGAAFAIIAENLPWFFRGIGHDLSARIIYAQEMETGGNFYGDVKELVKSDNRFTTKNPQKLPRSGNIFNFNRLSEISGKGFYAVLDEDGYLVISSPDGAQVWKSADKYGGSESFLKTESTQQQRSIGDQYRWTFLELRIIQMKDGTLLVPHNEGIFSVGNNRAFNKHTLFGLEWTGAVLKEKWHTRQSPGYLADYAFDQASGEVILLKVVQKAGIFNKGKSIISINKVE